MSAAANTPIIAHSNASSSAKYVGTDRLELSTSCHEARITSGTSKAINASMTSAMPSASKVNRAPQNGIHWYDSRNWKREPWLLKVAYMTAARTSAASDQISVTTLASCGRLRGR